MRNVRIDWYRLLGYSLLFLLFCLIVTIGFVFSLTGELKQLTQIEVQISGIELAFYLAMLVSIPFLLSRFAFFFLSYDVILQTSASGVHSFALPL